MNDLSLFVDRLISLTRYQDIEWNEVFEPNIGLFELQYEVNKAYKHERNNSKFVIYKLVIEDSYRGTINISYKFVITDESFSVLSSTYKDEIDEEKLEELFVLAERKANNLKNIFTSLG